MIFLEDVMFNIERGQWVEVNQAFLTIMGITTKKELGERLIIAAETPFQVLLEDSNGYLIGVPYDIAQSMRATWIRQTKRIVHEIDYSKLAVAKAQSHYPEHELIV